VNTDGVINLNGMHTPLDNPDLSARELADLSALADGTLDPTRRGEVEARIAASPELTALYERERRVVELMQEANSSIRAPAALRARIEASRPSRKVRARRRISYGGAIAAGLAAVVLALVLALPGGTPGAPSVSQAAGLAILGPVAVAPGPDGGTPGRLDKKVEGLYFPDWTQRLHWRASGQRTDRIDGRVAVTVYYTWGGKKVAYTIVSAPALKAPAAEVTTMQGVEYRTLKLNGRTVVTWQRNGHTCVLSATGVSAEDLRTLAAWKVPAE
jgi:hypothetical protein